MFKHFETSPQVDVLKLKEAASLTKKTLRGMVSMEIEASEFYKGKVNAYIKVLPALLKDHPTLMKHIQSLNSCGCCTKEALEELHVVVLDKPRLAQALPIYAAELENQVMAVAKKFAAEVQAEGDRGDPEEVKKLSEVIAELAVQAPLDSEIPELQAGLGKQMQLCTAQEHFQKLAAASSKLAEQLTSVEDEFQKAKLMTAIDELMEIEGAWSLTPAPPAEVAAELEADANAMWEHVCERLQKEQFSANPSLDAILACAAGVARYLGAECQQRASLVEDMCALRRTWQTKPFRELRSPECGKSMCTVCRSNMEKLAEMQRLAVKVQTGSEALREEAAITFLKETMVAVEAGVLQQWARLLAEATTCVETWLAEMYKKLEQVAGGGNQKVWHEVDGIGNFEQLLSQLTLVSSRSHLHSWRQTKML